MKKSGMLLMMLAVLSLGWIHSENAHNQAANPVRAAFPPTRQMQKLIDSFAGDWKVEEEFEISASHQGQKRHGTASFRVGPGLSLIENYESDGSAGKLSFLGLLWWDQSAQVYRLFTCANDDGCALRGTLKWEGNSLLNSWQEKADGQVANYKDSFTDISASSFRLFSEGSTGSKTIWRVITLYTRERGNHK